MEQLGFEGDGSCNLTSTEAMKGFFKGNGKGDTAVHNPCNNFPQYLNKDNVLEVTEALGNEHGGISCELFYKPPPPESRLN